MHRRPWVVVLGLLAAGPANAAQFASVNFIVHARSPEVARQVAHTAEHFRRAKAVEWLGDEIPNWDRPCMIEVKITFGGAGGATSFAFDNGRILSQTMHVEGSLDRILDSVLPHEITHTIFAARFRRPLPRWADEGGAVLSEDFAEKRRHDLLVREIINTGRMIPLRRLVVLTEYPKDVMALYAQGFSLANYLVSLRGRHEFLNFVSDGQIIGWDAAVGKHYGVRSLDHLEKKWIDWLIKGHGTGADAYTAAESQRQPSLTSAVASRSAARAPSVPRVVRGQMPDQDSLPPAIGAPSRRSPPRPQPVIASVRPGSRAPTAPPSAASARSRLDDKTAVGENGKSREMPVGYVQSAAEESSPANDDDAAPRRLIPIAVGRSRRNHGDDGGQ